MKRLLTTLATVIICNSCNYRSERNLIKLDNGDYIDYEYSNYAGDFIEAVKTINNVRFHYTMEITSDGRVLDVVKDEAKYDSEDTVSLDRFRSLELLISDTIEDHEPNFFGNPVKYYYSDTFLENNVINNSDTKIIIKQISQEEKQLFFLIDSVTKANKINYLDFDRSKVIGWFKYVF